MNIKQIITTLTCVSSLVAGTGCNRHKAFSSKTADAEEAEFASVTSKNNHPFNFCTFPDSLRKAVERELKMECKLIKSTHLIQIKKLKINNITVNETDLLDKKYAAYFPTLEDLDISNNPQMLNIPDFVFYIPKLKKLNISSTGIKNLNGDICKLNKLTTLIAAKNNYKGQEMPIAVFCLVTLEVLDMSYSSLRYIDEYIYYLKTLEQLYLRGNNLMITPVVLHLLPSLLVLDLRENKFAYEPVNSLHDCKDLEGDEKKKCQEKLLSSVECEYWYKIPFQRGNSFRTRYTEMTREPYKKRNECLTCNLCYKFWLNDYVSYYDPDKKYLLDLTINGKTMREWRLADNKLIEESPQHWSRCETHIKGMSITRDGFFTSAYRFFMPRDTSYGPAGEEYYIERYRSLNWGKSGESKEGTVSEVCTSINYNIPLPDKPIGPWSHALPSVQSVIDQHYPTLKSCEHWPTSNCKTDFPEEFYLLGEHSMSKPGLVKSVRSMLEKERKLNKKRNLND